MYLGSTPAAIQQMLASLPVVHTGQMDIYQSPFAVVRCEPDAFAHTLVRVVVDSTPTLNGRRVLTVLGMDYPI